MPKTTKPSTPSPSADSGAEAKKNRGGRPKGTGYHPTEEQRKLVVVMAGMGIPEEHMVQAVVNPSTKRPISPVTLRAHFREELDKGFVQANTQVAAALYKNATTATDVYPGGVPVAQIFWLKCRMRWQQSPHLAPPPPPPQADDRDPRETARRLAFLLAKADADEARAKRLALPAPKKKVRTLA